MSSPLVSFIIPYFNAGTTIQETIDSIFNQSYPNFDIWLINDGSTDQYSIDKLKDFERVRLNYCKSIIIRILKSTCPADVYKERRRYPKRIFNSILQ